MMVTVLQKSRIKLFPLVNIQKMTQHSICLVIMIWISQDEMKIAFFFSFNSLIVVPINKSSGIRACVNLLSRHS